MNWVKWLHKVEIVIYDYYRYNMPKTNLPSLSYAIAAFLYGKWFDGPRFLQREVCYGTCSCYTFRKFLRLFIPMLRESIAW